MEIEILVTAKVNPDLDGTACALAYSFLLKALGQKAEGILFGQLQAETLFFVEKFGAVIPVQKDSGIGNWKQFVLVDASSMVGMTKIVTADGVIEVIDHRETSGGSEFPNAKAQNELVGAAATLVWERLSSAGVNLPKNIALLIYGAIFHNSLNLLASNTTERDRKAVKELETTYGFNQDIIEGMFRYCTSFAMGNLEQAVRIDMKEYLEIGWGQLILSEIHDSALAKERAIEATLTTHSQQNGLSFSFLNLIDVNTNESLLFCSSPKGKELITKALGIEFAGDWARRTPALLRKQIMPRIKEILAKK
ncbi:MAG: DHH family phosphoesterase [Patescibacteria group bacterium]